MIVRTLNYKRREMIRLLVEDGEHEQLMMSFSDP
jgi:hypothetical protein